VAAPSPRAGLGRRTVFGRTEQRRPPVSKRYETKVRMVWGSFVIAAAALKTPTKNGCNAQGVNLTFHRPPNHNPAEVDEKTGAIRRRADMAACAPAGGDVYARRMGQPHTESNTLYRKVKHRARPNRSSRQRPKRAPIRRRSRRRQRRGEPHTEHGLGVLLTSHTHKAASMKTDRRKVCSCVSCYDTRPSLIVKLLSCRPR